MGNHRLQLSVVKSFFLILRELLVEYVDLILNNLYYKLIRPLLMSKHIYLLEIDSLMKLVWRMILVLSRCFWTWRLSALCFVCER
jgi:hypothetical protein